jgi:hypothetical protein
VDTVCVGIVKDRAFKLLDLCLDFVSSEMRFELREIVDSALAVRRSDNVLGVQPDVVGDFPPGSFNCRDRVG